MEEVAVKVPAPEVPVYFKRVVRFATPEIKSDELVSLFVPDKPEIAPESGELAAIVTLSADALNDVIVKPPASFAVKVFVPVNISPLF